MYVRDLTSISSWQLHIEEPNEKDVVHGTGVVLKSTREKDGILELMDKSYCLREAQSVGPVSSRKAFTTSHSLSNMHAFDLINAAECFCC